MTGNGHWNKLADTPIKPIWESEWGDLTFDIDEKNEK